MTNRRPKGGYLCPRILPTQSPWIRLERDTPNCKISETAAVHQKLQPTLRPSMVPMDTEVGGSCHQAALGRTLSAPAGTLIAAGIHLSGAPGQLHNKATLNFPW